MADCKMRHEQTGDTSGEEIIISKVGKPLKYNEAIE